MPRGTDFLCFAKESKQRKATRARIGPRCPRSVVSQTIKLFVSLPHSVRLDGGFKPQLNERGTASTATLNVDYSFQVSASSLCLTKLRWQYIYKFQTSSSCGKSLVSSRARNKRQGAFGGLCFVKARRLADCPQRGHPTKSDADTRAACLLSWPFKKSKSPSRIATVKRCAAGTKYVVQYCSVGIAI